MSFLLLFLGIVGVVVNCILAELLYEGLRRAKKNEFEIQWSARHFGALTQGIWISIFFLIVERNLQLLGSVMFIFDLTTYARWTLNNLFSIGFLCFFALRCWLLHFDYHTGVAMYVQITNIEIRDDEGHHFRWFLDNKTFYGSPKYLNTFVFLMVGIINIFLIAWLAVSPTTYYVGLVIVYSALMLIVMGITKKIAILDDEFFIRKELLTSFRILAGFFIFSGIIIAFGPVMGWEYAAFFIVEGSAATICGMGAISTWWMLDKSEIFTLPILIEEQRRKKEKENEENGVSNNNNNNNKVSTHTELRYILSRNDYVALFLKHLVRELSVENLFFLADVMAYKEAFKNAGKLSNHPGFYLKMPPRISKYRYNSKITFLKYAFALNISYIDNISAFYVTCLSDVTRNYIMSELENKQEANEEEFEPYHFEELACIFDPAAKEVYTLIIQALRRFKQSPDAREITWDEANKVKNINNQDDNPLNNDNNNNNNSRPQQQQRNNQQTTGNNNNTTTSGNNTNNNNNNDDDERKGDSEDDPENEDSDNGNNDTANNNKHKRQNSTDSDVDLKPQTVPVDTNDKDNNGPPTTNETNETNEPSVSSESQLESKFSPFDDSD